MSPHHLVLIALTISAVMTGTSLYAQTPELISIGGLDGAAGTPTCGVGTPDGGYLVCYDATGWRGEGQISTRRVLRRLGVVRIDPEGHAAWSRIYGLDDGIDVEKDGSGIDEIIPVEIARDRDGNYVIAMNMIDGRNWPLGPAVLVIDPHGTVMSHAAYHGSFTLCDTTFEENGSIEDIECERSAVVDMVVDEEGIVLLLENDYTAVVVRLDRDGSFRHAHRIDAVDEDGDSYGVDAHHLVRDSSGILLLLASTPGPSHYGIWRGLVVRLTGDTEVIDAIEFPERIDFSPAGGMALQNGKLLVYGGASSVDGFRTVGTDGRRIVSMGLGTSALNWIIDPDVGKGIGTILYAPYQSGFTAAAPLSSGEILLSRWNISLVTRADTPAVGLSRLAPDGTYLSELIVGSVPDALRSPEKGDEQGNGGVRTPHGILGILGIISGGGAEAMIFGCDTTWTPYLARFHPGLPFPCTDGEAHIVDTATFEVEMTPLTVRSTPLTIRGNGSPPMIRVNDVDHPLSLLSVCGNPFALVHQPEPSRKEGLVIGIIPESVRSGHSFDVSISHRHRSHRSTRLRIVNAASGEVKHDEGWETGVGDANLKSISTIGWMPGAYIVSIAIGTTEASKKVFVLE